MAGQITRKIFSDKTFKFPLHRLNFIRFKSSNSDNDGRNIYKLFYSSEMEKLVNDQINLELKAAKRYLAMFGHFGRNDVGYLGLAGYFYHMFEEENYHAQKLICYQNFRSGRVLLWETEEKFKSQWADFGEALCDSLKLEMDLAKKLYKIRDIAHKTNTFETEDFLGWYLNEQHRSIKELGVIISQLNAIEDKSLATYLINQEYLTKYPFKNV